MHLLFKAKTIYFLHHLTFSCSLYVPLLTLALWAGRLALGVAVEAPPAALTVLALCVAHALEASAAHVVAHPQVVEVHVAVALTPRARTNLPRLSQRVAVIAVFTCLAAGACRQLASGWRRCVRERLLRRYWLMVADCQLQTLLVCN